MAQTCQRQGSRHCTACLYIPPRVCQVSSLEERVAILAADRENFMNEKAAETAQLNSAVEELKGKVG